MSVHYQPPQPSTPTSKRQLPSAAQALSRLSIEDDDKRASSSDHRSSTNTKSPSKHRHTHSLGLLSPTASFASFTSLISSPSPSPSPSQSHTRKPSHSHSHSQSQSPIPRSSSSSSFTSSAASASSSQLFQHHLHEAPSPRTPHTPLRSATTPTPKTRVQTQSPLFQRLLHPFAKSAATTPVCSPTTSTFNIGSASTPTSTTHSPTSTPPPGSPRMSTLALHQPAPHALAQMYQPPSPTDTTHPTDSPSNPMAPHSSTSRSARLLRDALLKDEMERHPVHSSPLVPNSTTAAASTSPTSNPTSPKTTPMTPKTAASTSAEAQRGHRRRHSHIPVSTASLARAGASPERREEYTRGSFLFRTAMSNPRSVSPPTRYYGGDAEGLGVEHGNLSGQKTMHSRTTTTIPTTSQTTAKKTTATSRSRSTQSQSRSTSHSPSPMRRRPSPTASGPRAQLDDALAAGVASEARRPSMTTTPTGTGSGPGTGTGGVGRPRTAGAGGGTVRSRPPPIDLFSQQPSSTSTLNQSRAQQQQQGQQPAHLSAHLPAQQQQQQHPSHHVHPHPQPYTSPGEPLMMTPHEQVLRARLERVLSVGRVVERDERDKDGSGAGSRHRRDRRDRERSSEGWMNEVRDEEGGWPWRERGRGSAGVEGEGGKESAGSVASSGLYSSLSNGSGSSSGQSQAQQQLSMRPQAPRTPSQAHSRTRSKTDPVSPPPGRGAGATASPRRSSTAPAPVSASGTPSRRPRTGTTPPLVREGGEVEGEAEGEDGDIRLLTPPPTPPFTTGMFPFSGAPGTRAPGGLEYVPSPYKTSYPAGVKASPLPTKMHGRKLGFGMGAAPRRPLGAPLNSSSSEHEHDDASSSCSSNSQGSFPSSSASGSGSSQSLPPNSPPVNRLPSAEAHPHPQRPQFNARKASARCRAIEGYVSFASVEGLGEPPADPMSPDGAEEGEGGGARGRAERGVLGAAWGGWRRLLGVASGDEQRPDGAGVVL